MGATIILDVFEGAEMEHLLSLYGLAVVRQNLVPLGYADIFWYGLGGTKHTLEHKTIAQVMAEMGGRLDDQLRKHTQHADDVGLVADGIVTPNPKGGCDLWQKSKDGRFFVRRGKTPVSYESLQAYLWSIQKMGITVYRFEDLDTMCRGVAAMVFNSLKPEHRSLTAYIKSHPIVLEEDKVKERYIRTLMGLGHAAIGEQTARKILDYYKTPWDFLVAGSEAFGKVGKEVVIRAMRSIGRGSI